MEESKYYTPEIEEFHFGFEYEFITTEGEFKKYITNYTSIEEIVAVINHSEDFSKVCRVKYLDKEDIEELGWKMNGYISQGDNTFYYLNSEVYPDYPALYEDHELIIEKDNKITIIDHEGITKVNRINIKNKSELKKLMKQLEII